MKIYNKALTIVGDGAAGCGTCSAGNSSGSAPSQLEQELREIVARAADEGTTDVVLPSENLELRLSMDAPVPFVDPLHHQVVDSRHVWIGVNEAALAVFDDSQHEIVRKLVAGEAPGGLADAAGGWEEVSRVIGRLGACGLIRGLNGYRDRTPLRVGRFSRLHLTRSCQLECSHCYADSSPRVDRSNELPTARWLSFVEDFAAQGGERVLFTGGEALLHDGCIEIMGASRRLGLYVTLFSNGIRVPNRADEIHANADEVQISMDGPDAPSNDEIRGRNSYNHIIRAIDALAGRGTRVRIGMTIAPLEWETWLHGFDDVRRRYAAYPNVCFKLSYGVMNYGRGVSFDPTQTASDHEIDAFLAEVNGDTSPQVTRFRSGCGYGEQIVVGPDGTVYPCHLLDGPVCNIDDMPLRDIVALLGGFVRQVDVDHIEGCRTCELRYLCGGDCRVITSKATGSRLVTTCTAADKEQKYRKLVTAFSTTS